MGRLALHGSHSLASTSVLRQVGMRTGIDEDVTGQHCSALQHNCSLLDLCHLINNTLHSALQHSARSEAKSFCSTFCHPASTRPMPLSCKHAGCAVGPLRREETRPCLQSEPEEGIIALPSEVVGAAKCGLHVGNASASVQRTHPAINQPAGQPARREGPRCQEDKLELLRVGDDPPVQAAHL